MAAAPLVGGVALAGLTLYGLKRAYEEGAFSFLRTDFERAMSWYSRNAPVGALQTQQVIDEGMSLGPLNRAVDRLTGRALPTQPLPPSGQGVIGRIGNSLQLIAPYATFLTFHSLSDDRFRRAVPTDVLLARLSPNDRGLLDRVMLHHPEFSGVAGIPFINFFAQMLLTDRVFAPALLGQLDAMSVTGNQSHVAALRMIQRFYGNEHVWRGVQNRSIQSSLSVVGGLMQFYDMFRRGDPAPSDWPIQPPQQPTQQPPTPAPQPPTPAPQPPNYNLVPVVCNLSKT